MPAQPQFGREMHTRVPPRVQQIMAKKLERSVPGYMKQYVNPYMQQNVVHPAITGPMPAAPMATPHPSPTLHPTTGPSWRQNHFQATDQLQAPAVIQPTANQAAGSQPVEPYAFITDPQAPKRSIGLPGGGSSLIRIAYVAGGLLALVIIFSIGKNLVVHKPDFASYLTVVQDQQEMIHLVTNASLQQGLSTTSQNFVATSQLSLVSNQSGLSTYLTKNKYKVNDKQVNLKLNPALDSQLTTAASNTTYDQTFQAAMNTQLNTYIKDLKFAYTKYNGKHGRALLSDDYNQAQLLLTQLQGPANN